MGTPSRGSALIACLAAVALALPSSPGSAETPDPPVAIYGTLSAGQSLDSAVIKVQPTDAALSSLSEGDFVHTQTIPDPVVTTSGTDFTIAFDPQSIGAGFISGDGVVNVDVYLIGEGVDVTTTSLRAVYDEGQQAFRWVEPVESSPFISEGRSRSVGAGRVVPSLNKVSVAAMADAIDDVTGGTDDDDGTEVVDYVPLPVTSQELAACNQQLLSKDERSTTIGTTYPVDGDKAWMSISSNIGGSYGTAIDVAGTAGGFQASGEKSTRSSWGFTWAESSKSRSYRKGVKYSQYRYACIRSSWVEWRPTADSGETGTNVGITRPNWGNCRAQSKGVFRRDTEDGHAYKYNAGVKFKDVIGIDLGVTRQYSNTQSIVYRLDKANRMMCGNNDTPATAGKVMAKIDPNG